MVTAMPQGDTFKSPGKIWEKKGGFACNEEITGNLWEMIGVPSGNST